MDTGAAASGPPASAPWDTALAALAALGWVDGTLLAVLAVSVALGLWRGVVFELLSLAGWLVAWFGAQWAAPQLAGWLVRTLGWGPPEGPWPAPAHPAAFALAFLGALVLWSLLARVVRMLLHATPLSLPDRVLGAGFGLLRGAVLLLALAMVVSLTPAAQSQGWTGSRGAQWLGQALRALGPLLPAAARERLPSPPPVPG
jgi:membrane protein required for colicin V production